MKNFNNQLSFLFYLIFFSLKSDLYINKKTYLRFNTHSFITEMIVYYFFNIHKIKHVTKPIQRILSFIFYVSNFDLTSKFIRLLTELLKIYII